MLIEYKKKTSITFVIWLLFWGLFFICIYAGAVIGLDKGLRDTLAMVGYFGSMVIFFFLLYYLSKGKGYPGWYAAVGFLFILGLILILLLKDKYPDNAQAA